MINELLDRFVNNEERTNYRGYSLRSITRLLKLAGSPQGKIKTVHIAGTNGKGSTAHALAAIFAGSGYKTGLYTSPHFVKINERISINGSAIGDIELELLAERTVRLLEKNRGIRPTYFDILTLFAFQYFHENSVDIAIIETGLGGRLDSTNVITPLCSIITDVDIDHSAILGNDIASIAREKAGIIKPAIPVITTNDAPPAYDVIVKTADSKRGALYGFNRHFFADNTIRGDRGSTFDYRCDHPLMRTGIRGVEIPVLPPFQLKNFSAAITASLLLSGVYPEINGKTIRAALKNCSVPGRFMKLSENPPVMFDPGHNYQAVTSIVREAASGVDKSKIVVILSMMQDKDHRGIIAWLRDNGYAIVYFNLPGERSLQVPGEDSRYQDIPNTGSIHELYRMIINKKPRFLLFTGSFRLYSTARDFILYYNLKTQDVTG